MNLSIYFQNKIRHFKFQIEIFEILDYLKAIYVIIRLRFKLEQLGYVVSVEPPDEGYDKLKKKLANKIFGYLARCEGKFGTTTLKI